MTIDPKLAAAALDDIAGVERRTRQALVNAHAGTILLFWGVLVTLGYLAEYGWPRYAGPIWIAVNLLGLAGTVRFSGRSGDATARRIVWAFVVLMGYGMIWSLLIGGFGPRQLDAFWPTLVMCGYVLLGLWLGRFFIALGLIVTALTVVGFFWLGSWFQLWMATVNGGALLVGGLWLRR
jgi:hypothetical protein